MRDDGPLARALGRAMPLPVPAVVAALAGGVPLLALMAAEGDEASRPLIGVAIAWLIAAGAVSRNGADRARLRWALPPLLRLFEYAAIAWIAAAAGETAEPAAFALLCVLALRHYDLAYRVRHRGGAPPPSRGNLAAGWDGRLVLGYILLVAGALPAGFFVAAGLLATVFAAESVAGWRGYSPVGHPATYDDGEDIGQ
jgi:hypothetical protein